MRRSLRARPPFLLAGLARKLRRMVADEVRRVVQNAPFS